ncbi:DUF4468 domain-containing protein [Dysgonomonas sp. 216]|uniref:DUF4468 domain-containing protein n=1 Tax=Dysgonomonas sp. 216 TaxID=2302934 RepID=UPI0013D8918C|nr:DUF4468 domain-containing protein [Dysgonomonas sp. 216]NDW17466.1 DUF4468 domain-containing protein [Dysgonomonas sp. 216]
MMKNIFVALLVLFPALSFAQITKTDEAFTDVFKVNNKVVFIKEINIKNKTQEEAYKQLKKWTKVNFAKDLFNASMHSDDAKKLINAKSRIELVLPENSHGIKERMVMRYRLEAYFLENLCIVEVTSILYQNQQKRNTNSLGKNIDAESLITNEALALSDENSETRLNTKKSTLYFLNDLIDSLQKTLEQN